ncbi:MAG: hypothetical protein ACRBBQ_09310 [Cognatishimia sp.]
MAELGKGKFRSKHIHHYIEIFEHSKPLEAMSSDNEPVICGIPPVPYEKIVGAPFQTAFALLCALYDTAKVLDQDYPDENYLTILRSQIDVANASSFLLQATLSSVSSFEPLLEDLDLGFMARDDVKLARDGFLLRFEAKKLHDRETQS